MGGRIGPWSAPMGASNRGLANSRAGNSGAASRGAAQHNVCTNDRREKTARGRGEKCSVFFMVFRFMVFRSRMIFSNQKAPQAGALSIIHLVSGHFPGN